MGCFDGLAGWQGPMTATIAVIMDTPSSQGLHIHNLLIANKHLARALGNEDSFA